MQYFLLYVLADFSDKMSNVSSKTEIFLVTALPLSLETPSISLCYGNDSEHINK